MPPLNLPTPTQIPSNRSLPSYLIAWGRQHRPTSSLPTNNPSTSIPNLESQGKTKSKPTSGQHIQRGKLNYDRSGNTEFAQNQILTSSSSWRKSSGPKGIQKTLFDSFNIKPPENHNDSDDVWGHNPVDINDNSVLRKLFSNPRGIKLSTDILEKEHSVGRVHSLSVGILGLAETTVNWNNPKVLGALYRSIQSLSPDYPIRRSKDVHSPAIPLFVQSIS
jgi:hypothetical protein